MCGLSYRCGQELGLWQLQLQVVLEALQVVHSVGMLHGDIRPENIMVSGTDKAVLLDFGFAGRCIDRKCQREELNQLKGMFWME